MAQGPILVTGATGAQGGAAVDALLKQGAAVRVLVRNPASEAAQGLARRGVELAQGDFDDEASLARATAGARGVFSVQLPPSPNDLDSEVRTGRKLIDAARNANVDTFVHTSVARAGDQQSFVGWAEGRWWPDYWNSKSRVNDAVMAAGFPHWVILKPAFMMDNFIPPKVNWMFPGLKRGMVGTAMNPDTRLDLIAAEDVGAFAGAAFAKPSAFHRKIIDLAADSLTMAELAHTLSGITGKPITARTLTPDEAAAEGHHSGLTSSQQWCNVEGYKVDIAKARTHGVPLTAFADWAHQHRADFAIDS